MSRLLTWLAPAALAALLGGCGGGGGDSGPIATAPPVTGTPTAAITASSQTAGDAVTIAKNGASALDKVDSFSALPLGVQTAPLAVTTTQTTPCSGGGSEFATINQARAEATTAGDTARLVLTDCTESGIRFNGTIDLSVSRWVSDMNFALSFAATDLTAAQGGTTRGPFSFTGAADFNGNSLSYSFNVDGQAVVGEPAITRNGNTLTIASATVRANYGTGFVEVTFSGWVFDRSTGRPSAGTAIATGAGGNTVKVVVASDGYHATVTVGGVATNYVVAF